MLSLAIGYSPLARCQGNPSGGGAQGKVPMPEYIQEFFLSDAVRNEDKGELQLTLGVDSRRGLGTNSVLQTEYGLTNRLQLNFELPYGFTARESSEIPASWSTTSFGLQYQIFRSDSPFALSAGMALGVPVKSNSRLEYEPTILAAKTFRKLQVHASFVADVEQWKPSLQYNLASVYPVRRNWFPTLEFNGRRLDGRNAFYLTPGLYRHFAHRLEVGIGVPAGLAGIAARVGIVAKVNWELGGGVDRD
jgi:hypothetical protein